MRPSEAVVENREARSALAVSVIVLASRPREIERCLESLERAAWARPSEILVWINGHDTVDSRQLEKFRDRIPGLRVEVAPRKPLGEARNAAIEMARHDALCFLDDDVIVPATYFITLSQKLALYPEASVLGGPNRTPEGGALIAECIGRILESPLGAGPMRLRYRSEGIDRETNGDGLILCNLVLRKQALERHGLRFPDGLMRNEENLLLEQLFNAGETAVHCPDLFVFHARRSRFFEFFQQCFLSGEGRGRMTRRMPSSIGLRHLAPALIVFAPFYAIALVFSAWKHRPARKGAFLRMFLLYPTGHIGYAVGLIKGLVLG